MWTRSELKDRAKEVLKTTYWKSLLVSFIIAIAGGGGGGSTATGQYSQESNNINQFNYGEYADLETIDWSTLLQEALPFIIIGLIITVIIIGIVLAFRIFLGFPLEVGGRKFFIQSAKEECSLELMGHAFNKGRYIDTVKAMFLRGLYTFLWSLLLIIPGIIAYYSYYMVPYILADNANIGSKETIELSKNMTRGYKLEIFVLELSFIGWYILCLIPAFIGIMNGWYLLDFAAVVGLFLIAPYVNATKAQLYLELRRYAIEGGMVTEEELNS